jgi:hypothetical protein
MKSKIHPIEHNTIEMTQNEKFYNSRLACGIRLKPWMNEVIVSQVRQENSNQQLNELSVEGY